MTETASTTALVTTTGLDIHTEQRNVHYARNEDLTVILRRGGHGEGTAGYVLVSVEMDDQETNLVEVGSLFGRTELETLEQALDVMTTVRDTLVRQGAAS